MPIDQTMRSHHSKTLKSVTLRSQKAGKVTLTRRTEALNNIHFSSKNNYNLRDKKNTPRFWKDYVEPLTAHRTKVSATARPKKTSKITFSQRAEAPKAIHASLRDHYHLKDRKDVQRFCEDYSEINDYPKPLQYIYTSKPTLKSMEAHLMIAPVSVLKNDNNSKIFGIFTTRPIQVLPRQKLTLGFYLGDLLNSGDEGSESSFVMGVHDETKVIDAKQRRNFIPMINNDFSLESPVKIACLGDDRIEYYFDGSKHGLYIPKDTQILVNYGSTEKYDDFEGKRYLNPNHLWEESNEIYQKYQEFNLYQSQRQLLDPDFLCLFDITPNMAFAIPQRNELASCFDIPHLACSFSPNEFLPQNQQEYITPLMLACWKGDCEYVTYLLECGSNPNLQSSIAGLSAFHIVILSPYSSELKKQLLDILGAQRTGKIPKNNKNEPILPTTKRNLFPNFDKRTKTLFWHNKGCFTLQDKLEKTILHHAIMQNDEELVSYLITNKPEFSRYQDAQNHDPLESAILQGNTNIIQLLLPNSSLADEEKEMFIDYHLEYEEQPKNNTRLVHLFKECRNRHQDDEPKLHAIYDLLSTTFLALSSPRNLRQLQKTLEKIKKLLLFQRNILSNRDGLFNHQKYSSDNVTVNHTQPVITPV
jgi:ankyrin repeat protein